MSARDLVETATNLIINQIQSALPSALADIRTSRPDSIVNTEIPLSQSYFYYKNAAAFRAPAVFVVAQDVDFHLERGQNFISAVIGMIISVVVEERTQDKLSQKAWRFQDALHECLQGISLQNDGNTVRIVIKVMKARFSEDMSEKGEMGSVFRKEVAFDCDIELYEGL